MRILFVMCGFALVLSAQVRSVGAGVYSAAQASRGQQLFTTQCVECHGTALQGNSGPPLTGNGFLQNWSAQPLANLVNKIQKTMPFGKPANLTRAQSIDLAAYILQTGKYPAGQADLQDAALAQVTFPNVPRATAVAGNSPSFIAPEGNLAELMRAIAFPNANTIFNVQLYDPGATPAKKLNTNSDAPFNYVEWGATIYPGWQAIDYAAIALTETAPLLLTPGRKCQNGLPVPVERADWKQYVNDLVEVGKLAHKTAQDRNFEGFIDVSEKLNDSCANCHRVYRDRGGREGSGAMRCQPLPAK